MQQALLTPQPQQHRQQQHRQQQQRSLSNLVVLEALGDSNNAS
jgi:hypothetical protein